MDVFKIPGYGCSYHQEYSASSHGLDFSLSFHVRKQRLKFKPAALSIYIPLEAGRVFWRSDEKQDFTECKSSEILVTSDEVVQIELEARSRILKLVRLDFTDALLEKVQEQYPLRFEDVASELEKVVELRPKTWAIEVIHRLVFEYCIARDDGSLAAEFCRLELAKEVFYLLQRSNIAPDLAASDIHMNVSSSLNRVIGYIEAHLYKELEINLIAAECGISVSTIQRLFRKELNDSPLRYLWRRRLQDSYSLLSTGRFGVSEVAYLVGFQDASAFSKAFSKEFGKAPSQLL